MEWIKGMSVGCVLLAAGTAVSAPEDEGFSLIWEEEFDQPFLDDDNWEFLEGNGQAYGLEGWGNNELQYYTGRPQNLWLQNGTLRITAQRENFAGYDYTSARIRTSSEMMSCSLPR